MNNTARMLNAAYQLSVAAENVIGDEVAMVEIAPLPNGRLFIGICLGKGSKIIPELVASNIEARGFTIEESEPGMDGAAYTAQVVPTERVPNIQDVVGA